MTSGHGPGAPGAAQYRPEIDGLRALAVGGVVAHHTGLGVVPGGFTGVDVFFVISGYLITGIIAAEMAAGKFSQWRFLERRIRRIVPALAAMLLVTSVAAWAILTPEDFRPFAQSLTAAALFASNLLFARETGYFDSVEGMLLLLHTWTLGVEEQFYLIFPLVLIACLRWRREAMLPVVAVLGGLSFVLALVLAEQWPQGSFYLLPTRFWEFALGAACALLPARPRGWAALSGLALIVAGFGLIRPETPAPGAMFLLPTVGTALVILFAAPQNTAGRLLAWRPFAWLGLVSFGTYLWHQPLLVLARYVWFGELGLIAVLALVAGSVALGAASYTLIEQPVRQKRLLASRGSLLLVCAAALAVPALAGVAGHLRWLLPASGAEAARLDALRPPIEVSTKIGSEAGAIPYVLFGDSHAGQYRAALAARFGAGVLLNHPSCLAAPGVSNKLPDEGDFQTCRASPERLVTLARQHGVRTIIWAQMWAREIYADGSSTPLAYAEQAHLLEAGMQRLADRLPAGTRIIIMGNVPTAAVAAPQVERGWLRCRAYLNVACPISYPAGKAQGIPINTHLRALAARDPRFVFVDTAAPLCRGGQCLIVQDGTLNYWDPHHITHSGAWRVVATMPALPPTLP